MSATPASGLARATWTIEDVLRWTTEHFKAREMRSPRLDAEVLLASTLRVDRVYLYTHYDQPLTEAERSAYRHQVRRRSSYEPVAYITGEREFFGRSMRVSSEVLIPRPETEHIVEIALRWLKDLGMSAPSICDVGTGSGALAITLAAELPGSRVTGIDIAPGALVLAQRNALEHGVAERINWYQSDLLGGLADDLPPFDLIVSNPPYIDIREANLLQADVYRFEPSLALFAEENGLAIINRLGREVPQRLRRPGLFLCEIGAGQEQAVLSTYRATNHFDAVRVEPDLAGHPRVVVARRNAV